MEKTFYGKSYNTDSAAERGFSVGNVEIKNGIKTLVIDRKYEGKNGEGWFVVTTISRFKTNNDFDHLTSDDVFLGSDKNLHLLGKENRWVNGSK